MITSTVTIITVLCNAGVIKLYTDDICMNYVQFVNVFLTSTLPIVECMNENFVRKIQLGDRKKYWFFCLKLQHMGLKTSTHCNDIILIYCPKI